MAQKSLNKITIVFIHILIWILMSYVFLFHNPIINNGNVPIVFWVQQVIRILILVVLYYINGGWIFEKTLKSRKYFAFILWVFVAVFSAAFISGTIEKLLRIHEILMQKHIPTPPYEVLDGFMLLAVLMVLGISTSIEALRVGQRENYLREEAEKQMTLSELAQLKSQINPHFFFNTLNNIYSLSYINIDESRKIILKLSRMMRYLIYETKPDRASLKRELEFIEDYIDLNKIRLSNEVRLQYSIPDIQNDKIIAPMVLLPFVENAFKHGISNNKNDFIKVEIILNGNHLKLIVENTISENQTPEKGGLGIENTRKRLDIVYVKNYTLDIEENKEAQKYIVNLQIDLV